ncbi:MAG: hypothetical protein U0840_19735 [Gemmataceae bacterium]
MATFYLLPGRSSVSDQLVDSMGQFLPGIDWPMTDRLRLGEILLEQLALRDGVYLVFRDELPRGAAPESALIDGYGAESGDEVVEVRPGLPARRWRIGHLHLAA